MKKVKKILAALLAMVLVLGMGVTASAKNGTPEKKDKTTVKIQGLDGKPTVTLYKIASAVYGNQDKYLVRYELDEKLGFTVENGVVKPTVEQINAVANELVKENRGILTDVTSQVEVKTMGAENTTYESCEVGAGLYIAVISGANGYTYNPVLLSATYGTEGSEDNLVGGALDLNNPNVNGYLYGSTATAKRSKVGIDKQVTGTSNEDDSDKNSASVGDVLTYTVTPTMPSYPEKAVNKTFFLSDTMSAGQTFLYDSLEIRFKESPESADYLKDSKGAVIVANAGNSFTVTLAGESRKVAEANATIVENEKPRPVKTGEKASGFFLNFDYEKLVYAKTKTVDEKTVTVTVTDYAYIPVVTYKAVLNEDAVVGGDGNTNTAKLFYSNQPNSGSTHKDPGNEPDPNGPGMKASDEEESKVTVYTYQLAFHKTGDRNDDDKKGLGGATFGIYKTKNADGSVTDLVDTVITNSNGYAVSSKVGAGTYYIKEIAAPSGYSLNDQVYSIIVKYSTATTTATATKREYTTDKTDKDGNALEWVGWIKNKVFYSQDAYEAAESREGFEKAYLLSTSTTTTAITLTNTSGDQGTATKLLGADGNPAGDINNTKLSALPSTGGIGTTIFTVGGCALMIIAAGLYFATRRKNAK